MGGSGSGWGSYALGAPQAARASIVEAASSAASSRFMGTPPHSKDTLSLPWIGEKENYKKRRTQASAFVLASSNMSF